ncbi:MAG: GatB/YqeY domain-containing protein [Anaerolineae bacterium]|nr:GatB/YqeY domain-containing protein [Anaerolineae bacterium]
MGVQEELMADLKNAMRTKDTDAKRAIRMALAELKNARVAKNADLAEEEMIAVLQKQVRQCQDAIVEYKKGGRDDLVAEAETEIQILERYLPAMMSRDEVASIAREAIAEIGASSPKQMGQVMRVLMSRVEGRADGRMVSQVVKEMLQQ